MTDIEVHASSCNGRKKRELEQDPRSPVASIFSSAKKVKTCANEKETTMNSKVVETRTNSKIDKNDIGNNVSNVSKPNVSNKPLAELMRPTDLSTYKGQEEVLGKGTQIRKILDKYPFRKQVQSMQILKSENFQSTPKQIIVFQPVSNTNSSKCQQNAPK